MRIRYISNHQCSNTKHHPKHQIYKTITSLLRNNINKVSMAEEEAGDVVAAIIIATAGAVPTVLTKDGDMYQTMPHPQQPPYGQHQYQIKGYIPNHLPPKNTLWATAILPTGAT